MVLEGLRAYVQLASGLTELTRQRARAAARTLLDQGTAQVGAAVPGSVREQLASLTDDLLMTARQNRALLLGLVEAEVEGVADRLGLVSGEAFARVQERADRLEMRVRELELALADADADAGGTAGRRVPAAARAATSAVAPAAKSAAKSAVPPAVKSAAAPAATPAVPRAAKSAASTAPAAATRRRTAKKPGTAAATPAKRAAPKSARRAGPHGDALLDGGRDGSA